jgi:hypothetical protein
VNQFTKVQIALAADASLQSYFEVNKSVIDGWFNVIAPRRKSLAVLRQELNNLKGKNWERIHS